MVRALYIHHDMHGNQLVAVFEPDADMDTVRTMARELAEVPYTDVSMSRGSIDDVNGPKQPILMMGPREGVDVRTAVTRMKELTDPVLPHTLISLTMTLILCECGYVSSKSNADFMNGLEPDDLEGFWLHYHARVKALDMLGLISKSTYTELMDALQEVLRELDTYASTILVNSIPDDRPCTHPL